MSAALIKQMHPWGRIFLFLGELDVESLQQTLTTAWRCTVEILDGELGKSHRLAMSARLDYTKRIYGSTNFLEEERLLRDLLGQPEVVPVPFGGNLGSTVPRVMLNLAHNLNRQQRYVEAGQTAHEVLLLLQNYGVYGRRAVERIEAMKVLSHSQFGQGDTTAEETMQEAIQMIVDLWGLQHSWVPEFKIVLEGWLRGWGREKDADILRGEIQILVGLGEF